MGKIALIIPTLNELENIEKLVTEIKSNLKDVSIFIVDDSNDNSLGEHINKKKIQAHYFHRKNSSGRGSAIMFGLKKCLEIDGFDIFIEMDADFSHDPKELPRNINYFLENNLDLLIASRYLKKSKIVNWSLSRRIFSKLANFLAKNLLSIKLSDFTNGFRIYSKRSAEKITKVCGNIGDGFIILSEIIVVLNNNNFKIGEIETYFLNRERGKSSVNFKLIIASFLGLLKLRLIKKKLK